jgi:CubicO group peptidase (beta-lactamase class C family)
MEQPTGLQEEKMNWIKNGIVITLLVVSTLLFGCDEKNSTESANPDANEVAEIEAEIRNDLDSYNIDTDFTLMIEAENGRVFIHSTGNSSETTSYESASTSKFVTAAVILSLVKDGVLSLEDHPQDYISTWPSSGNLSDIELRDLLSFTSGLVDEPACINAALSNLEACVERIATKNSNSEEPGEVFYYASTHLQVAGLMAVEASGLSSWQEVFEQFKSDTGLFSSSYYDLPSLQNPRLAGGMHWAAEKYFDFLEAVYKEDILNSELIDQMTSDQIQGATIGFSPAFERIGEDWHYGFGNWIECHSYPNNCVQKTRISSAGAYGSYPFIDYENGYYGIIAMQGALGTGFRGYELFESVSPKLEIWASMNR